MTYMNQIATSTVKPRPERLPPTERAAHFHVLRGYLQAQQWMTLMTDGLNPTDWGWCLQDGRYEPILTDLQPAPDDILNVVRCKCNPDGSNPCGTKLCSCRKHGLSCVPACKNCYGELCTNANHEQLAAESADSGDDDLDETDEITNGCDELVVEDCLDFLLPCWEEEVVVE